ncbi:hypothetical protein [Curtobacterium sp. VKM Ac-2922]|uniref:hypothetical protein n=1 Tax=Curtobacterium sp. VKM Ac-2922 TaxID=2929475 RepID=UPI001FB3E766|nr:hypothetical protein [Curtobacterium sp. VKM Ac-2922]
METQSGARTPLVDPFGRELEEWLRDAPATRAPYVSDLVVPPVTGPVQRPDTVREGTSEAHTAERAEPGADERGTLERGAVEPGLAETATARTAVVAPDLVAPELAATDVVTPADSDQAFRRPRDHGRHASVCAPSFPEPPERIALRIDELAVQVSAQSGRPTIERIVVLEDEVRRRDEDLARLTAWEAVVAHLSDPEVEAARAYARSVFADLLADAADEADRRDRAAARRAATGSVTVVPATPAPAFTAETTERRAPADPSASAAPVLVLSSVAAPVSLTGGAALGDTAALDTAALDAADDDRDEPARPVPSLQSVPPVSANTRPTPLIQPATGPTVIDRDAFAAVLRTHRAETAGTPVVFPAELAVADQADGAAAERTDAVTPATSEQPGWWARAVAAVLRLLGRR